MKLSESERAFIKKSLAEGKAPSEISRAIGLKHYLVMQVARDCGYYKQIGFSVGHKTEKNSQRNSAPRSNEGKTQC